MLSVQEMKITLKICRLPMMLKEISLTATRNIRLLVRDLPYVSELVRLFQMEIWGRIEDILGQLTMMFQGAGSNNYSIE
jgi:hypothetical protein